MAVDAGLWPARPAANALNNEATLLEGLIMGIVLALWGACWANDYRGKVTAWWQGVLSGPRPLQSIPPWRWLRDASVSTTVRQFRVAGALTCVVGVASVVRSIARMV